MASIIRDQRRGTWLVQWNDGERWVRKVIVRRPPDWKRGDPMADEPPAAVVEALNLCRLREQEMRREREVASRQVLADLLARRASSADPAALQDLARRLERAFRPFREFCAANGIDRLDEITPAVWLRWAGEASREPAESVREEAPANC